MRHVIVVKRKDDYIAYVEHAKELWGCGNNVYSAIGDLIMSHPDLFVVKIFYDTSCEK